VSLFKALSLPSDPTSVQRSNRTRWNGGRSKQADFYTIGYVGREPSDFVQVLLDANVLTVMDIRYSPVSQYRPQFSKENLRRLLGDHGIEYIHRRDLGVPRDVRGLAIDAGKRDPIWEWYDNYVVPGYTDNLSEFFDMLIHPVAFLCVEADPTACHRHRLSLALERKGLRSYDL